jgi:hypothetical protein
MSSRFLFHTYIYLCILKLRQEATGIATVVTQKVLQRALNTVTVILIFPTPCVIINI